MTQIISFTQDGEGRVYGYDNDEPSQALAQQHLEAGHSRYTPISPTTVELLAQAQQAQVALIDAACAVAITGGFQSSALGKIYIYPSNQTDQANLSANVVSSLLPGASSDWTTLQMCCDANGEWGYVPHTVSQIQQVGTDGKAAILGCLTKKDSLQEQIAAATTVAEVQSLVW